MAVQRKPRFTPEEYLALERQADYKSEYYNGEIFAMAGASREHNVIVTNIVIALGPQLRGRPCEIYSNDMRVKVSRTGLYTYPDVVVVCGSPEFEDAEVDTLLNPTVIVEVLSPSTEGYDRGAKFEQYRTLPSLSDYIVVAQDKYHVEHHTRQASHRWLLTETNRLDDVIHIASIQCDLPLREVYDKVKIEQ